MITIFLTIVWNKCVNTLFLFDNEVNRPFLKLTLTYKNLDHKLTNKYVSYLTWNWWLAKYLKTFSLSFTTVVDTIVGKSEFSIFTRIFIKRVLTVAGINFKCFSNFYGFSLWSLENIRFFFRKPRKFNLISTTVPNPIILEEIASQQFEVYLHLTRQGSAQHFKKKSSFNSRTNYLWWVPWIIRNSELLTTWYLPPEDIR